MRAGDVVVDDTETFRVIRSAADGGRFEFELELAPGASGPPLHTHTEPEECEVVAGSIVFWLDGVERRFSAGDKFVIPPGCAHTFKNPSAIEVVRARGWHGGRFERLVDQLAERRSSFLRLARYATEVDPNASYMISPLVRAVMTVAAWMARIGGVRLAPATGAYGTDGVTRS
jgi:quercetin dioxygenase-like cupin family protein